MNLLRQQSRVVVQPLWQRHCRRVTLSSATRRAQPAIQKMLVQCCRARHSRTLVVPPQQQLLVRRSVLLYPSLSHFLATTTRPFSSLSFQKQELQQQPIVAPRSTFPTQGGLAVTTTTTTTTTTSAPDHHLQLLQSIEPPTRLQLRHHFYKTALPLVGFGFMDVTILIQSGHAIDCTLGVWLGLSTMAAAALGSLLSNVSSVVFGGWVAHAAHQHFAWLHTSVPLSPAQKKLPRVQRTVMLASLGGMLVGCLLGLVNLFLIDTTTTATTTGRSSGRLQQQQQQLDDDDNDPDEPSAVAGILQLPPYQIVASNTIRPDATVITVRGPDRQGLLASLLVPLAEDEAKVSVVELSAHPDPLNREWVHVTLMVVQDQKPLPDPGRIQNLLQQATMDHHRRARQHLVRTKSQESPGNGYDNNNNSNSDKRKSSLSNDNHCILTKELHHYHNPQKHAL